MHGSLLLLLLTAAAGMALSLSSSSDAQPSGGAASPRPRALRDLEYDRAGERKLLLDLYLPAEEPNEPLPVIVWFHGGGWRNGDKGLCRLAGYASRGYAVASVGYRLSQEAVFPAQIHDCKSAVRWLRANAEKYRLDPERIGVAGSSAGGHLAALLGTSGGVKELEGEGANLEQSSRVQAVCNYWGPTDLLSVGKDSGEGPRGKLEEVVVALLGGPIEENREKAAQASPVTHVSKDDPPFLTVQGGSDPIVPVSQVEVLHEALTKAGVESTLEVVKGAGHSFDHPEIEKKVEAFFDRHLKKPVEEEISPRRSRRTRRRTEAGA